MIKFDIVTMLQGDEPLISLSMIEKGIIPLINDKKILVTNLAAKIYDKKEFLDKNCIKVVFDKNNDALMFSRNPIPSKKLQKTLDINKFVQYPLEEIFLLNILR